MCKRAWYIKFRATNCAPKNNEEKKHRRVPACNLQPSQFNFDRGLQYEYQKTSNLNIHQISTQLRNRPAPNNLRAANIRRFLSSNFPFSEQLYVFLAHPENRHKNYDFSKFPIFPEFSIILKNAQQNILNKQNFYILSQHLLSGHQYFARQPGSSLSTVY